MNPFALCLSPTLRDIERQHADLPLMQRAGAAAAAWAAQLLLDRKLPILVLAGPGNNGGDALEVARLLQQQLFDVRVIFASDPGRLPPDALAAWQRFSAAGGTTQSTIPEAARWGLIIDGLFGIGLTRAPAGVYARWIEAANQLAARDHCPLLALDSPSGLNADSGCALAPVMVASHTLTFIANKPGLLTNDGPDYGGEIRVADLDLPGDPPLPADGMQVSQADFAAYLQPRRRNTHKGSFGNAGILGGGPSMLGAACLAARAALKLGAGRVYLGALDATAPAVDFLQPEIMWRQPAALLATELQALACGPGLGTSPAAADLLAVAVQRPAQLVLDADALNLLAADNNVAKRLAQRSTPAILTPHPTEAARLLGCSTAEVQADRITAARQLAARYHSLVVLKGCGSVIAAVDGRFWINSSGNPGMASAGMGDVLSGLLVALLAQDWPAEAALLAAVHLHGAAADRLVGQGVGPIGLTAGEVIDAARHLFNDWVASARAR